MDSFFAGISSLAKSWPEKEADKSSFKSLLLVLDRKEIHIVGANNRRAGRFLTSSMLDAESADDLRSFGWLDDFV